MPQFDKPNVAIPLAASYNERGVDGFAASINNLRDQVKINSFYEPATNAMTGKTTLYLVKRPGISGDSGSTYGVSGDVPYLNINLSGPFLTSPWVIHLNGSATKASSSATNTTIQTSASTAPAYITKTIVSGTATAVLQILNKSTLVHRTYYASTIGTWTEITDADFTALTHRGMMAHLDGYAFQMTSNNRIYNSDLNSLSAWTASSYLTKQAEQDTAAGLMRLRNVIVAFGTETAEAYYNAGNPTGSVLSRIPQIQERIGLSHLAQNYYALTSGGRHYYTVLGQHAYFVGRAASRANETNLYAFDGSRFEKVSTPFIDKILSDDRVTHVDNILFYGKQAVVLLLTTPTDSTQNWLMYFPYYKEWFQWTSTYVQPVNDGQFFIGIGGTGSALKLTRFPDPPSAGWVDGSSDAINWYHQFQLPSDGNQRKFMDFCALKGNTQASAQSISVTFSDDDSANFDALGRTIDMTSKNKMITRCGSWQGQRFVRLFHSGNTEVRLESFLARVRD